VAAPDVEVIIPVGPGHEYLSHEASESAAKLGYDVRLIDDTSGKYGRSVARNYGVQTSDAEWIFFLDADDLMHKNAKKAHKYFNQYDAIWGLINDGQVRIPQVRQVDFNTLLGHDPTQTLQMGHFVRRDVALNYPFDEALDCGEDFDYYLRIWSNENCIKIPHTLFVNRRGMHSTGPRSANGRQWRIAVKNLQDEWLALQRTLTTKPSGRGA
jgi:glycosyltransferase involved in cell wall biosynthesis